MYHHKHLSTENGYLVYTRRSTDDQIHQKNSIEYQISQCRRFSETNHLTIAGFSEDGFCEKGIIQERHTAFKTSALDITAGGVVRYRIDRPRFQRLVALLSAKRFKGAICLCWDRLSRNPHDDAVVKDLIARGVDVRFVQATYDNSSAGALHMDIDGMFAAHYSRVMSEKIRAANSKLRAEGKFTVRAPVGYLDRGSASKPLDPERAPIVRRLFEMYATGEWSFMELGRWADKTGLTTKPVRPHRSREQVLSGIESENKPVARPITEKTIENILNNPFYAGVIRHGKEEVIECPGRHEPLVSPALFQRVQSAMKQRNRSVQYIDKPFFAYRAVLRCTNCSRSYSPYLQKGLIYYYSTCKTFCDNDHPNLRNLTVDAHVLALFNKMPFSDQELRSLEAASPGFLRESSRRQEEQRTALERRRLRAQRDLEYLEEHQLTLLREGVLTPAQYSERATQLRSELEQVAVSLSQIGNVDDKTKLEVVLDFSNRINLSKSTFKAADETEKRRLFTWAFLELGLYQGNVSNVRAKKGFDILLNRPFDVSRRPNYVFLELSSLYNAFTNPELQSCDMPLVHTDNESSPNLPPPVRRRGSYNSIAV